MNSTNRNEQTRIIRQRMQELFADYANGDPVHMVDSQGGDRDDDAARGPIRPAPIPTREEIEQAHGGFGSSAREAAAEDAGGHTRQEIEAALGETHRQSQLEAAVEAADEQEQRDIATDASIRSEEGPRTPHGLFGDADESIAEDILDRARERAGEPTDSDDELEPLRQAEAEAIAANLGVSAAVVAEVADGAASRLRPLERAAVQAAIDELLTRRTSDFDPHEGASEHPHEGDIELMGREPGEGDDGVAPAETTDEMRARWSREHTERMSRRIVIMAPIVMQLRELGVEHVTVQYFGSGDSGDIEAHEWSPEIEIPGDVDMNELVTEMAEFVPAGYEINDGGDGELALDVEAGQLTVTSNYNQTDYTGPDPDTMSQAELDEHGDPYEDESNYATSSEEQPSTVYDICPSAEDEYEAMASKAAPQAIPGHEPTSEKRVTGGKAAPEHAKIEFRGLWSPEQREAIYATVPPITEGRMVCTHNTAGYYFRHAQMADDQIIPGAHVDELVRYIKAYLEEIKNSPVLPRG
jgi:hypothetical protein